MLLFHHYSSLIIKPLFLKFFFLCLKSKIVQRKTQFDMNFDSYRQMIWRYFKTLKCYIFTNFVVFNNLIKFNYLLKVCLWKPIKFSSQGVLNCSSKWIYHFDIFHCVTILSFFLFVNKTYFIEIYAPTESKVFRGYKFIISWKVQKNWCLFLW